MRSTIIITALAAAGSVNAGVAGTKNTKRATVTPITTKGNAFFKGEERFYVRGIAYQPGGSSANLDPLADPKVCLEDIKKFADLGINVVRVYSTDNTKDHKECMEALADAGIYVALDVNNPLYSINRATPHPSYNAVYLQSVFATIDEFAKYDNTFAFFSGNEVIHDEAESTLAAPYVKATDRDMRAYIKARKYRPIPVGYSAADVSKNRMQTAKYFNCGTDEERSDFFAFNDYSWCKSNFKTSGWDVKVKNFTDYGLPIFLSEYGCTTNGRDFHEVEALMSDKMTGVYSGGLMYEYTMEENGYGIVNITKGKDITDQTGKRIELPEFEAYKEALEEFPAPKGDGGYAKTTKAQECPPADDDWLVENADLPEMPAEAKKYLEKGAGKGPGLDGPGSQWAGEATPSSGGAGTGSGSGSGSSSFSTSSPTDNAAGFSVPGPINKGPFVVTGLALLFTLVGAVAL